MRYNPLENVPAPRTVAERPSMVAWCCGKIAAPGQSTPPKIGTQVSFSSPRTFLFFPLLLPRFRPGNNSGRRFPDALHQVCQANCTQSTARMASQPISHHISHLHQQLTMRGEKTHLQPRIRPCQALTLMQSSHQLSLLFSSLNILITIKPRNAAALHNRLQRRQCGHDLKVRWRWQNILVLRMRASACFINQQRSDQQLLSQNYFQNISLHFLLHAMRTKLLFLAHLKPSAHGS